MVVDEEEGEEGNAAPEEAKKLSLLSKFKGKKKLILIVVPIVLSLIGGGAFLFIKKRASKNADAAQEKTTGDKGKTQAKDETLYFDLDEFIVNLDKGEKQPNFLKMSVSLQLSGQAVADKVKAKIPVIRDAFQVYLRELRGDDLQGSAGIYRLREELLLRVNNIMAPDKVDDILFKEILVQ
jgi:flagellar FliL protein